MARPQKSVHRGSKLRLLDLFSGMGGMSLALRSVCKTVGYCEVDEHSVAVLRDNIKGKRLRSAPVHGDVRKLGAADLRAAKPEVIAAGFPCQDISSAGLRAGVVHGQRSGLFREVVRLARTLPTVKYVLLENVPNIFSMGLQHVVRSFTALGFDVVHGLFQANEVGAMQKRKRWFALCIRRGALLPPSTRRAYDCSKPWRRPPPRLIKRTNATSMTRLNPRFEMLGNSVVPACVAFAWDTLVQHAGRFRGTLDHAHAHTCKRSHSLAMSVFYMPAADTADKAKAKRRVREQCMTRVAKYHLLPKPLDIPQSPRTRWTWATPGVAFNGFNNIKNMTSDRGFGALWTQILYEADTQRVFNKRKVPAQDLQYTHIVNPQFVEWLMGYPLGWTRAGQLKEM